MLTLLDQHTGPPGGFRYFESATRTWLDAATLLDLTRAVITHRTSNGLPNKSEEETSAEIQDQLCRNMPPSICRDVNGVVKMSGVSISLDAVKRGAATLADFILHGSEKVSYEDANRRARICAGCYANIDASGANCTTCAKAGFKSAVEAAFRLASDAVANAIVHPQDTEYDGYLKVCAVCACPTRYKVWVPLETIKAHTPPEQWEQLPDFCWMRTDG